MAIGIVVTGIALGAPTMAVGAGFAAAAPQAEGCHTGARVPTSDPHEYDSCIAGEWGNVRQCPPFTVVSQTPDGDIRCVNE
ncbi:hypothetical protein [Nocardia aurantiaca]|uniref:Uncharacterized protein n=1 Tax=Nocardia aurantiaca TaxID=2675850 RepID=A0A6I3L1B2_9NOCA|nr:hypothetical protein [Nocardia aurantiaca]MTE15607.1 hypothetical protein [Nocardia aurantiaca]